MAISQHTSIEGGLVGNNRPKFVIGIDGTEPIWEYWNDGNWTGIMPCNWYKSIQIYDAWQSNGKVQVDANHKHGFFEPDCANDFLGKVEMHIWHGAGVFPEKTVSLFWFWSVRSNFDYSF